MIPENVTPFDWLVSMTLLLVRGYSESEAREIVEEAARLMKDAKAKDGVTVEPC